VEHLVKLSLYLPTMTAQRPPTDPVAAFEQIRDLAVAADEAGFATIWVPGHFMPFGEPGSYVFEAWTTLAALARETTRIRLGQLVTGNGYRNPALLAKMASTLDVIAAGRFTFGIGAGWFGPEYEAFGFDFPRPASGSRGWRRRCRSRWRCGPVRRPRSTAPTTGRPVWSTSRPASSRRTSP
jgi:alkanesulfonate monooxygenase SsuD/methylene tetrahydromethanopterin reductase-like flavin-dependent oxidoreductase (luciferase family)